MRRLALVASLLAAGWGARAEHVQHELRNTGSALQVQPARSSEHEDELPAWFTQRGQSGGRQLLQQQQQQQQLQVVIPNGPYCGPLSRELVMGVAKQNTVMVTIIDKIVWKCFGPSYVENIMAANITYWLIAALDPETSMALGTMGVKQCFNAPQERLKYKGKENAYAWGSHHWTQTTWNKVHVMKSVYEMGVHVVHSDADVVWFSDPLPYFMARLSGPADILMCTDAVNTGNAKGDYGPEATTNPHTNINTGVYFMRQWPAGLALFDVWLTFQDKRIGHDQDGFNYVARGHWFHGDPGHPVATGMDPTNRIYKAAYSNATAISFLPASSFGNAYTFINARLWEKLQHPLYEVHFVWGGSTMESKRQNMRDAMKFHDEPPYYDPPGLITFGLEHLEMPFGFSDWGAERTEEMIRFHVTAANHQLQQAYFAFAAAVVTNRTLVMPRFRCYCSKNWYQTQACRINHETATTFPFVCALSHVLRVKKLQQGFSLPGNTEYSGHRVYIREYSFMENPKVPQAIKNSYLEIVPSDQPRAPGLTPEQLVLKTEDLPPPAPPGARRLTVAAPIADWELRTLLAPHARVRVLHFPKPAKTLSGFARHETAAQFDEEIQKRVTYFCCRSPPTMKAWNLSEALQLVALPFSRYKYLPQPPDKRSTYLHQNPPLGSPAATLYPWRRRG